MMDREKIKLRLGDALTPKRFIHSLNVMNTAEELAKKYGINIEKAALAGLLHDCAREIRGEEALRQCEMFSIKIDEITKVQPELLHGMIGAEISRTEYGVEDEEVLKAIRYHTTGCANMGILEKIIFIADYIEPNRNFPGVIEARKAAFNDIDSALVLSLDTTIKHVIAKGALIHPDTIDARNYIVFNHVKYIRNKSDKLT